MWVRTIVAGGFALGLTTTGLAQGAALSARLVARGDSTTALRDVEVTLEPGGHLARSDSTGRIRINGITAGEHVVRARRLGFEPLSQRVMFGADGTVELTLALRSSAEELATITVLGKDVTYPARLAEPYKRLARGTGRYFTREQIDSMMPRDVQSLLMHVPGVHVTERSVEFARCRELSNDQKVQVWVDGNMWTRYNLSRGGPAMGDERATAPHKGEEAGYQLNVDAMSVLKDIQVSSIQLMEIYAGAAKIPGEYVNDACAVIVIWRK